MISDSATGGGALLGIGGLLRLGGALQKGAAGQAAGAAALLALVLASPLVASLGPIRRLLEKGYTHGDIVHALRGNLDRQKQELEDASSRPPGVLSKLALRVAQVSGGVLALGLLAAFLRLPLPERVIFASTSFRR